MQNVKLVSHLIIIGLFLVFISKNKIYAQNEKDLASRYEITQQNNLEDTIEPYRNSIYAELAGSNIYYSIGYSRVLIMQKNYNLSVSIGFSTNFHFRKPWFSFGIPISINNRFKFWRFNGIDIGINLGNFMNIWTLRNKEKYYTPHMIPNPPLMLIPSAHLGWAFRWKRFTLSPRFYTLFLWSNPPFHTDTGFQFSPFFGVRGWFKF